MEIKEIEYDEYDCYNNDEAVCPYCGYKCELIGEDYGGQDEELEMECFDCGKTFIYTTDYSVTFSTEPYENWVLSEMKSRKRHIQNYKDDMNEAPEDRSEGLNKEYYRWIIEKYERDFEELVKKAKRVLELN